MNQKSNQPGNCDWLPEDNREEKNGASCDWSAPQPVARKTDNRSAIYTFCDDYTWQGVEQERYKAEAGGWAAIARNVLIGARGESVLFDLRYFEIAPGGHSSLEKHQHEHVVVGIRGRGQVLLGGKIHQVGFLDTLYLAPDDPHQLLNPFDEPFGFFCIVNHDRDRPRPVDADELKQLLAGSAGKAILP